MDCDVFVVPKHLKFSVFCCWSPHQSTLQYWLILSCLCHCLQHSQWGVWCSDESKVLSTCLIHQLTVFSCFVLTLKTWGWILDCRSSVSWLVEAEHHWAEDWSFYLTNQRSVFLFLLINQSEVNVYINQPIRSQCLH